MDPHLLAAVSSQPQPFHVVLSCPGVGMFVQQTARALYEAGLLKHFVTTLLDQPAACWRPWLTGSLDTLLKRRSVSEFPSEYTRTFASRELLRLFTRQIDWTRGVLTDAVWEWAEQGFDRWVAARALTGADAVYGYEHASLETFRGARRDGIVCFYEVPAPEAGYAQAVRDREIAAYPALDSLYEQRLRHKLVPRQERRRLEWLEADTVIASSEFTRSTYREAGYDVSRVRVVPLAAPPVCPEDALASRVRRAEEGAPLRFLSMGSFTLHKGSHYLLEAWRKFAVGEHAQLEVVGRLDLPAPMLRGLPDSVRLRGAVPAAAALEIYRDVDVLVFPTLADGFGMVVSEALSHGLPVITTPCAGASEIIRHGENGLIVPAADAGALAEAMQWCLDHREALAAMAWRARETAARWQWADYRHALVDAVQIGFQQATNRLSPLVT